MMYSNIGHSFRETVPLIIRFASILEFAVWRVWDCQQSSKDKVTFYYRWILPLSILNIFILLFIHSFGINEKHIFGIWTFCWDLLFVDIFSWEGLQSFRDYGWVNICFCKDVFILKVTNVVRQPIHLLICYVAVYICIVECGGRGECRCK